MLGGRYSYLHRWEMRSRQFKAILRSEFKASQCNETQSQKQCSRKQTTLLPLLPGGFSWLVQEKGGAWEAGVWSPHMFVLYL